MKKFLLLSIAAVLLVGMAAPSFAATTGSSISWTIQATVSGDNILFSATVDPLGFPVAATSSVEYSNGDGVNESGNPRCTITNIGLTTVDLQVQAAVASVVPADPDWTLAAAPGDDIATISGVWTTALDNAEGNGRDLDATDFGPEDVIPVGSWGTATATDFASPNDSGSFINGVGVNNILNQNIRSLRFQLQYPTGIVATGNVAQNITITISAGN